MIRQADHQIEFRTANFVIITQAAVGLAHQLAKRDEVSL
jgi:hypothetical protein